MKKFFSLIALVGVFAACQKEDLKIAFTIDPAVATITASAVCIDGTALDASQVTFTFSDGVVEGNVCTITGTSSVLSIDKVVTATATWKGYDGEQNYTDTKEVTVNVLAGGKGSYKVNFILGEMTSPDEYTYDSVEADPVVKTDFYSLVNEHLTGHSVTLEDGTTVYVNQNPSEFILRGSVEYTEFVGKKAGQVAWSIADAVNTIPASVYSYIATLVNTNTYEENAKVLDITVSAFAQYYVLQTVTTTSYEETITRTDKNGMTETIAVVKYDEVASTVNFAETACEGHEAHYVPGHGHEDHGHGHGSNNAGGGIVYAD